ncbi:hypothetical protein ACWCXM_40975 [Streptomyces sp. 900105755]
MRHSQIAAQHVDAHLSFLQPLIGKPCHRVGASHPNGRLVRSELLGRSAEPFDQHLFILAGIGRFIK